MFILGNSTDASLLLRFSDLGVASGRIAVLWAMHNVVRMISTWFGGRWSDRLGRRRLMVGFGAGTALAAVAVAIPARVPDPRPLADSAVAPEATPTIIAATGPIGVEETPITIHLHSSQLTMNRTKPKPTPVAHAATPSARTPPSPEAGALINRTGFG